MERGFRQALMKICIYGVGAIGGYIGAKLGRSTGVELSAVARGATLQALQTHGLRLHTEGQTLQAPVRAVADPAELGPQDVVIVAVKGPAMADVAGKIGPLLGPHTLVVPAMNGILWWFQPTVGVLGDEPLHSVDAGGKILRQIPVENVIGCVVHIGTSTPEPGLVEHQTGNKLVIGEPRGGLSQRAHSLAEVLRAAGIDVVESDHIQRDLWFKLWGNLTINPVSAVTGATVAEILGDPLVRQFCTTVMLEAAELGRCLGCPIDQTPEDRHLITERLGGFKSSMLQDVEAGRSIELDSIVSAVQEMAQRLQMPAPNIDALLGLARLFGRVHGLYPRAV